MLDHSVSKFSQFCTYSRQNCRLPVYDKKLPFEPIEAKNSLNNAAFCKCFDFSSFVIFIMFYLKVEICCHDVYSIFDTVVKIGKQ